jgi:hypothetical protein
MVISKETTMLQLWLIFLKLFWSKQAFGLSAAAVRRAWISHLTLKILYAEGNTLLSELKNKLNFPWTSHLSMSCHCVRFLSLWQNCWDNQFISRRSLLGLTVFEVSVHGRLAHLLLVRQHIMVRPGGRRGYLPHGDLETEIGKGKSLNISFKSNAPSDLIFFH